MCLTNKAENAIIACSTEIFTFAIFPISFVTRFTGAGEGPLSVLT